MASSIETPSQAEGTATAVASAHPTRIDTLAGLVNPYGLLLSDEQAQRFVDTLAPWSLHRLLGFLCGALWIPEPLPPLEWVEFIDRARDADEDFEEAAEDDEARTDEVSGIAAALTEALDVVAEHVRRKTTTGEIARLMPVAADADACSDWLEGFDASVCTTLHEISDAEAKLRIKLRAMRSSREPKRVGFFSMPDDVAKLIAIWREVPPYDPTAPEPAPAPAPEPAPKPRNGVIHAGGTYLRATPKVGRNDLCPCGSGKKYKKCCA